MKKEKKRLDILLVEHEIYPTRAKAQAAIMAGLVRDKNNHVLDKAGALFAGIGEINVIPSKQYVGRGAIKLKQALIDFKLDDKILDRVAIDVGASTGGFSQILLEYGASLIYAVDSGTNQLDWSLRSNEKIISMEQTSIRSLDKEKLYGEDKPHANLAVIDVSFISLKLVLPHVVELLKKPFDIVALIKPQFEAGKEHIAKGGIVKDQKVHEQILKDIEEFSVSLGLETVGITKSSITGTDGNQEYFIHCRG